MNHETEINMNSTDSEIAGMTSRQAIQILRKHISGVGENWGPRKHFAKALELAIRALEQTWSKACGTNVNNLGGKKMKNLSDFSCSDCLCTEVNCDLYRVTVGTRGACKILACDSEADLMISLAKLNRVMCVTNVVRLEMTSTSVRTPKIAYRNNPIFKQYVKELQ